MQPYQHKLNLSDRYADEILANHHKTESTTADSQADRKLKERLTYLQSMSGLAGFERNQLIRDAFKVIIDNLIPSCNKVFYLYFRKGRDYDKQAHAALQECLPQDHMKLANELRAGPLEYHLSKTKLKGEEVYALWKD